MAAAKVVGSGICDRVLHGCGGLSYQGRWAMVIGGATGGVDWRLAVGGGVDDEHSGSSEGLEVAKRRCRGEELVWWQYHK